jgi:SAM-dependent methyltransferase
MTSTSDPTRRFCGRAENYARHRPSYPRALLDLLREETGLTTATVVADVGSGTGILSEIFLENGNCVLGIEPNPEMRAMGESLLRSYPRFTSVAGTAEATTLDDGSVDLVAAGQAFHWFDPARARPEFGRILRSGGWVVLVWNVRRSGTPFLTAFERLLQRCRSDYEHVRHDRSTAGMVKEFFGPDAYEMRVLANSQALDLDGLKGRLLSSSYVPGPRDPGSEAVLREAAEIFTSHQREGMVHLEYDTRVYYGRLTAG